VSVIVSLDMPMKNGTATEQCNNKTLVFEDSQRPYYSLQCTLTREVERAVGADVCLIGAPLETVCDVKFVFYS
jgi:hypothetical protein